MFLLQRLRANDGSKILAPIRASKQRLLVHRHPLQKACPHLYQFIRLLETGQEDTLEQNMEWLWSLGSNESIALGLSLDVFILTSYELLLHDRNHMI